MNDPTREEIENIAAMRADGSLHDYLQHLAGRRITPKPPTLTAVPAPAYRITHTGGWPLGTAATGPLAPSADQCTCAKCGGNPASRAIHQPQAGEAA